MRSLALFWCASIALAQSTGSITGTVLDLSGDPVVNAPIQATNRTSHVIFKANSAKTGRYTLSQLPPGIYELSVAAPGFNAYAEPNLTLAAEIGRAHV